MFCSKCAATLSDNAMVCPACGAAVNPPPHSLQNRPFVEGHDWLTTLLLCLFLGKLGVHRFYTGQTGTGLLMLFTFGGCGIWWLIDLVFIITESFRDSEGRLLVKKN